MVNDDLSFDDVRDGNVDFEGRPYVVIVRTFTREDQWMLDEEWAVARHLPVGVYLLINPNHATTPIEVRAAYRWAANILGRAGVQISDEVRQKYYPRAHALTMAGRRPPDHRCSDDPLKEWCGLTHSEGVTCAWWQADTDAPVSIEFMVPIERTSWWIERARRVVSTMLSADAKPMVETTPAVAGHQSAVVATTTSDPRSRTI